MDKQGIMWGSTICKDNQINPDLLTVYASLVFVIGALITLAAPVAIIIL